MTVAPPKTDHELAHERQELLRFLNVRSAISPLVTNGGSRIDFLGDATGTYQLCYLDETHPWPQHLTFGTERVQSARRSPDGSCLIYATDVGGNERSQLHRITPDGTSDVDLTGRPDAFHTFGCWSPDARHIAFASNRREPAFFDAYVMELETHETRPLLEGSSYFLPTAFSPDGSRVVVWELLGSFANRLYEVEVATGVSRRLTPEDELSVRYHSCHYSADGKSLLLVSDRGREFMNVARLDLATLELSWMTDETWDVDALTVSDDHQRAAVVVNEDGVGSLRIYGVKKLFSAPIAMPALPLGGVGGVSFSPDGDTLAFHCHGPRHAPDIYTLSLKTGELRQRTFSSRSGLAMETFVEPQIVRYKSFDGREIPGNLYVPPHAAEAEGTLPVVIHVHGGPESQARVSWRWLVPYLVGAGYGVFTPNVRGSTGYGRTFAALDDTTKRLDSVKDLVAAATWLKELGPFDPEKVVVMGGSYGGYMTLAAISMFPEHWAAGIDIVGIANLRSFIANTGPYRRRWRMLEYGDPDIIGDFMDEASPINHAHKITAPLMVIHGANDPRVPQDEADQIVAAVKAQGGDVEYLLYPDEGHGISKLHNRIHCYSHVVDFLDRHLKDQEDGKDG